MDERSSVITLAGQEYELLLTTAATKAISKRYGGLEKLGEKLEQNDKFDDALNEIVWLIALLANQPINIWNLWHPEEQKAPLTPEMVELLTTPFEIAEYKDAITEAMYNGAKRYIKSEEIKNMEAE